MIKESVVSVNDEKCMGEQSDIEREEKDDGSRRRVWQIGNVNHGQGYKERGFNRRNGG